MTSNDAYVLEILLENGLLSDEHIEAARAQMNPGETSVVDKLIELDMMAEVDILAALASQFGMELVSLEHYPGAVFMNRMQGLMMG